MRFPRLTIEISPRSKAAKSRRFRSRLVGYLTADSLWSLGSSGSGAMRPVWLAFFNTVGEAKPFTANLRAGRKARSERHDTFELPRSSGHHWTAQSVPGGVITVAYLPELFHLEPPVPFTDDGARFVMAPTQCWVDQQAERLTAELGADGRDAARAALFAAYLDRRTPLPLLRDLSFHLQLYRAALDEPWVADLGQDDTESSDPTAWGLDGCGLDTPIVCSVDQESLSEFLTRETSRFHRLHARSAQPSHAHPSLDFAQATPPAQLVLDLDAG